MARQLCLSFNQIFYLGIKATSLKLKATYGYCNINKDFMQMLSL